MVVVRQLVHTVDYTVACMMMTHMHVMMIELPLHWWVELNHYIVTLSLVIQSHTKTENVNIVKNDIDYKKKIN